MIYIEGGGGERERETYAYVYGAFRVALVVKNLPDSAGDVRDVGLIPGSGRSPEGGHGNPLLYSCLENAMDRGVSGRLQSKGLQRVGHD